MTAGQSIGTDRFVVPNNEERKIQMSYVSLAEAAVRLQVPVSVLREMCERKMIEGAVRFGRIWTLPEHQCDPAALGLHRRQFGMA